MASQSGLPLNTYPNIGQFENFPEN